MKAKLREDRIDATCRNETWATDFVHNQLVIGSNLRILTIINTFSCYSPATNPRFSYKGEDVVQTLERGCRKIGYPKSIRVDNGSEFISCYLGLRAYQKLSFLTSHGLDSRQTKRLSKASIAVSAGMPECILAYEP